MKLKEKEKKGSSSWISVYLLADKNKLLMDSKLNVYAFIEPVRNELIILSFIYFQSYACIFDLLQN